MIIFPAEMNEKLTVSFKKKKIKFFFEKSKRFKRQNTANENEKKIYSSILDTHTHKVDERLPTQTERISLGKLM